MRADLDFGERAARILIVDDDPNNRQLLEIMLAPEGFILETAGSGESALARVAEQAPDLILLDIFMPGIDGYQVAEGLKGDAATKNIPIIIITGTEDRATKILGLTAGAEDFLIRPVDRAELCTRVRNLLRLKAYGDHYDKYSQRLEDEVMSRTAALGESERLYRSTFDAAPVGIVHIGLDGRWLRFNNRLCELLGYSREELQGSLLEAVAVAIAVVPGEAEALRQMAAGRLDRHTLYEKRYRRRDGSVMWATVNMSIHRDTSGQAQHVISVIQDTTEQRQRDAQLWQRNKLDAIGGLASGVAHDFNNLLTVVLSYSELLAAALKEGDPMLADLTQIRKAGLRAVDLTRQLLAFSRQQVLQPKIVDLGEVSADLQKMLGRLLGEDVELCAIRAATLGKVLVDPGQMEQVIMNLAINARDAMPQGGKLTIETRNVFLDAAFASEHVGVQPGPHVMLAVSDTGTGMDAATLARIFEPFFTTKELGKGTGLGLATVFGIVRQSGGTIWVDSEQGKGTTFKVYFTTSTAAGAAGPSLAPVARGTLRGTETILLVEDEPSVRTLIFTILRKYGYNVLEAQSGGDALLLCEQHQGIIDLLLTDVVMPRMSGRQLAERLLCVRPDMKVMYMSGYMDDAVVRHGIVEALVAFIQKPITPEALARKLRETLDSKLAA